MIEIDGFYFAGYGWICKRCQPLPVSVEPGRARVHSEGEGEQKELHLASPGLAKWRDASRQSVFCPVCGTEEWVNKA